MKPSKKTDKVAVVENKDTKVILFLSAVKRYDGVVYKCRRAYAVHDRLCNHAEVFKTKKEALKRYKFLAYLER
jgi:hypothetical protein